MRCYNAEVFLQDWPSVVPVQNIKKSKGFSDRRYRCHGEWAKDVVKAVKAK